MLENWLYPSSIAQKQYENWQFGAHISSSFDSVPNLNKVQLVIIGIDPQAADIVREALYNMSWPFGKLSIADMGNLRKTDIDFFVPLLTEVLRMGVTPILIGSQDMQIVGQFLAYQTQPSPVNLLVADRTIRYSPDETMPESYLYAIIDHKKGRFSQCSMLGYQTHYTPPSGIHYFDEKGYDAIRMGRVRAALEETEPIVRDADMLAINLQVVKASDAPGVKNPAPTGLTAEELIQICRYAGLSNRMTSFGLYGYVAEADYHGMSAHVAAQMCWYFCDGYRNRMPDYPISLSHLVEYIVNFKRDYKLSFWKSTISGRWWMQIPFKDKKSEAPFMVSCSYNDYLLASKDELPERLLNAIKRKG